MNFCSNCGAAVSLHTPAGDDRPRFCCTGCGMVHYQNPKMVVGCIPERDNEILLCRRAIEPCIGKWTLPAGYLENGETTMEGARREAYEEARAQVEILAPYAIFDLAFVNQIYLIFRARLCNLDFRAGEETAETRLFAESDIPWDEIAFTAIYETLRHYIADRRNGMYHLLHGDILARDSATTREYPMGSETTG